MGRSDHDETRHQRRSSLRVAVVAGVLLLLALGAGTPARDAGARSPHHIIFDAAATPSWIRESHGPGTSSDAATDVVMAKGGITYVTGYIGGGAGTDASLMKLVDGVPAWPSPRTYDSPFHGVDMASHIALGPHNTVYTAGASVGASGMFDILLLKWSSSGAVQWARRYDGPAHGPDRASGVVVDPAGNVTVCGSAATGMDSDWVVVSWSASGVRRWSSRHSASGAHTLSPTGLVVAGDGSVYASGYSMVGPGSSAMTVRYSAAGRTLWKKVYEGPSGLGAMTTAAVARPGGGVCVCGATMAGAAGSDGLVMSYTPSGARDVFALDTGPGGATDQQFNDIAVTSTKQVVAAGSSTSGGNQDCRVVSYSTAGTIADQLTVPGAWADKFEAVAADTFGGFYATGTYHTALNRTAVFTARGSVLTGGGGWRSLWTPGFVSDDNEPHAIAVRGSTACVAGECSEGAALGIDQMVLGYVY
jgi:hypothetical protein